MPAVNRTLGMDERSQVTESGSAERDCYATACSLITR